MRRKRQLTLRGLCTAALGIILHLETLLRLGYQLRLLKEMFNLLTDKQDSLPSTRMNVSISDAHSGNLDKQTLRKWYDIADEQLFAWIRPGFSSSLELRDSFSGEGIVICVFNKVIDLALINLLIVREAHQSRLPIEIFYMGEGDLSLNNRMLLESSMLQNSISLTPIYCSNVDLF
jgi:hypothetical protein